MNPIESNQRRVGGRLARLALAAALIILPVLLFGRPAAAGSFAGVNGKIYFRTDFNKIASIESNGSGYTVVNTAPQYHQSQPSVSADGTMIAFARFTGVFNQIHTMTAAGGSVTNVSNFSASETSPSWSLDGTKIAFESNRSESSDRDIYVMNANGSGVTRLTGTSGPPDDRDDWDIDPAWSPDGTKIAYASYFGDGPEGDVEMGYDIWIMNADGTGKTRLTTGGDDTNPVWSPDGTKIAFTRLDASVDSDIYYVTVATQVVSADLTSTYSGYADSPSWSPDGTKIVFAGQTGSADWELFIMNAADGSGRTQLTNNSVDDMDPYWATKPTGIIVEKQTVPDGSAQTFTFDPSWSSDNFTLGDGDSHTAVPLSPGVYSVSEIATNGWTLSTAVCTGDDDGASPASINLEAGELVTCVFTNTEDEPTTGAVTVVKQVAGQSPDLPWAFDFSGDLGEFNLSSATPSQTFPSVTAGEVTITEDALSGYLISVSCDSGETGDASVTIDLAVGEEVTCTFTNSVPAGLTIIKEVGGDNPPSNWSFDFDGDGTLGDFTLTDALTQTVFTDLPPATYAFTETVPADYATAVACDNGDSSPTGAASVTLDAGKYVTCLVTNTYTPPPVEPAVFISTWTPGTVGSVSYSSADILQWDGSEWSKWFDGAAAGLSPYRLWKHNINALYIPDPNGDDAIMSFTQNQRPVPGVQAKVDGMDLVRWDGSAFSVYFDGQDVDLNLKTKEKIDALHILDQAPPTLPGAPALPQTGCLAYLLVSTQGPGMVRVPGPPGSVMKFGGEDVLAFCATALGDATAGLWSMALDGSVEGLRRNAVDSLSASDDGQTIYLTTQGAMNVDGAVGGHSMVYRYDVASGLFSGPTFSAPAAGITAKVDGLQVQGEIAP